MSEPITLPDGCNPDCPGCAHRQFSAAQSETRKAEFLARRLAPWSAQLAPLRAVPAAARWGYRDRATLSAQWTEGGWQFGLMRRDELIPIPDCPVHSARLRDTARLLAERLPEAAQFPLHYLVQSGAQCTLVLKCWPPTATDWLDQSLRDALAALGVEGLWLHCNPAVGRKKILHKRDWQLLWGEPRSRDALGLWQGPAAFTQLIPSLCEASREEAAAFLDPQPGDRVVDLYCGSGGSLRRWLAAGAQAIGVELGGEALDCAAVNTPGATLLRGACEARLPQVDDWLAAGDGCRLLYANPPRTGLETGVLDWIGERARPERIAYLSCSAGTLARDLTALERAGYRIERIAPYDFFPQTLHVETLALLTR